MLHVDHSRHAQSPGSSLPGTRVTAHGKRAAPLLARFLLTAQGAGASGLFSQPRVRHGAHGIRKKGNGKLKKRTVKRPNTSLKDLSKVLEDHGRHSMLSFLSSLPISVLRILDTEANKSYDRNHQLYDAALLTRCYTQHALRPFIDSEINHKQHFIKIPFINKGIEFIDFPSIFKDRSVTSLIPAYFQNSEPPIICYKYNKPIRNTVFNFNKLVSDLDIHANTPES